MKIYQLDLFFGDKTYTYTGTAESLAKMYCQFVDFKLYVVNNLLLADCSTLCKLTHHEEITTAYIAPFKQGDNMYSLFFENYLNAGFGQESWKITELTA